MSDKTKVKNMMRVFYKTIFIIPLLALWLAVNTVQAAQFIEGFEDIPIPDEMSQMSADNVSFGNEEARFVEAYLQSDKASFAEVESFYMSTLPQLGRAFNGKQKDVLHFYRDGENLDIALEGRKPLIVRITIKSRD